MSEAKKVIVVGAGQMGLGIAHAFASSGYQTALVDISQAILDKATATITQIVADGQKLGKVTPEAGKETLGRLTTHLDVAAAGPAELYVETATENLQLKTKLLQAAEAALGDKALIATNTSALSISEMAATLKDPTRVFGLHFFNPVHKMKLVEVVRGLQSSDATIAAGRAYVDAIGKTGITVNEAPGLTTSRMSAMAGNEAMYMLSEGTATAEDIDTALRLGFNHPMGPLELGDLTGWDTRLAVLRYLHSTLGEKFRPCPLIVKMVAAGRYGRKVGHGVYRYEDGKKVPGSGLKVSAS